MSELILNVSLDAPEPRGGGGSSGGNRKHRSFVRRRRFLEAKGALRQKQLPAGRPKAADGPARAAGGPARAPRGGGGGSRKRRLRGGRPALPGAVAAIDCEMVGTGPGGRTSALARCSVVAYDGAVLYDRYVRPPEPVVDYRTRWSGIRPRHLQGAVPFATARRQILKILSGKVVVGHAISNDFKALKYFHPPALTRDTSRMPLLNRKGGFPENVAISLKRLVKQLLNRDIQVGKSGHSSVEDARATMELYKVVEAEWEQQLTQEPQ